MLDSFPVSVLAGLFLGYLAGIGVGGGSLLILWLTLALGIEQFTARSINLMFFIASAGAVSLFRWKQGTLHLKKLIPAIVTGCISAAMFAWLGQQLDIEKMQKLFGILLLVTGLREVCYRPKELR